MREVLVFFTVILMLTLLFPVNIATARTEEIPVSLGAFPKEFDVFFFEGKNVKEITIRFEVVNIIEDSYYYFSSDGTQKIGFYSGCLTLYSQEQFERRISKMEEISDENESLMYLVPVHQRIAPEMPVNRTFEVTYNSPLANTETFVLLFLHWDNLYMRMYYPHVQMTLRGTIELLFKSNYLLYGLLLTGILVMVYATSAFIKNPASKRWRYNLMMKQRRP